ncbi:MAG TPA: amidohydrolase family protein [Planctomycetaceae bacterium]|nr:amidohydrolase family protein [Planctomycetaceae bacterium]
MPLRREGHRGAGWFVLLLIELMILSPPPPASAADVTSGFQPKGYRLRNVSVVAAAGQAPVVVDLLIEEGLISAVGTDLKPTAGTIEIDLEGFYVYPGLIDAFATDLIKADYKPPAPEEQKADFSQSALAATRSDHRHSLTPSFDPAPHLDRKSDKLEKIAAAGFTVAHVVPVGRVGSGRSLLLSMKAGPIRESLLPFSETVSFRLFAPGGSVYPSTLMGATAQLRQAFEDSHRHAAHRGLFSNGQSLLAKPPEDPDWEVLHRVSEGELASVWQAESRDDIFRVLTFLRENGIKGFPLIEGGEQAHLAIDALKESRARLILSLDFGEKPKIEIEPEPEAFKTELKAPLAVQQEKLREWETRVRGLGELAEAGIPMAVSSQGLKSREEILKALRTAVEEGLPESVALDMLTGSPARMLGMKDRLGSIEPGKLAHLVVTNGPLFDQGTKLRMVFVDGQKQEIDEKLKPNGSQKNENAVPAQQVAGTWNLSIESDEGKALATIDFVQNGDKLSGQFQSEQGDGRLRNGRVKDKDIEWEVAIGAGARELILKFRGTIDGENLSGELTPPFGKKSQWNGVRQPLSAPKPEDNPVQITLENPSDDSEKTEEIDRTGQQPTELRSDRLKQQQTKGSLLLTNATILTGTGERIERGSLLVRDGKIAAIGQQLEPEEGTEVLDLGGKYVIPGIIDTHSHIMITQGINESTQSIVPEVRIRDVVNTDDASEYRALAGGVTAARLFHGSANVIGGQDAVVKLKYGRTAAEHLVQDAPQGVKFALGENVKARSGRFPNSRLGVEATLQRAFLEAIDYRRQWIEFEQRQKTAEHPELLLPPRRDYRLEALADIVNHQKFIHSHCYRADEILMLLRVTSDLGIRVWSLQHVLEGYKVAPEIVAHGASCSTFADWWAYKVEAYDAIPHNAAFLHAAGANTVIKSDDAELIRHLYLEAAKTVRYGNMPEHAALQAITRNPARELGLDERMGTLEVGKDADFAVFNGHPLNGFSRCEMTFIEGDLYFNRGQAPSAMSSQAVQNNATTPEWKVPGATDRPGKLDLETFPSGRYALTNATLHPIDGAVIPRGTLLISGGRIESLGQELALSGDVKELDLRGLHVYPGLIDAGTTLGLTEIGRVDETSDFNETGRIQPDLRAGVAINPDSELIPVARAGGITTILAQPKGGFVSGQSSLIKLQGWTAPEMALDWEFGLRINWPSNDQVKKSKEELTELFERSRLYESTKLAAKANESGFLIDPRYEAMLPYLNGKKPVLIEAHSRDQIVGAVEFAESHKLKLILTGATDAWKVAQQLAEKKIPAIVGPVMRRPVEDYDPFDAPYANPGLLSEAGVRFCIRSDHAANSRNAPFEAAMAVAYGLSEDEGVRAVTLSAAEILGLDSELGSLTAGKRATLIITDGSPLQQTTQIQGIFVDGHPFDPTSRQTRFHDKYHGRLLEHAQPGAPKSTVRVPQNESDAQPAEKPAPAGEGRRE